MADLKRVLKYIDKECRSLCIALNKVPGIETIESCCGHGESHYGIYFEADSLETLHKLYCEVEGSWDTIVLGGHSYTGNKPYFGLYYNKGIGEEAYKASEELAQHLDEIFNEPI